MNHPTHKGVPVWSMDHEKTKSETRAGRKKSLLDAGNVDTTSTDSPHDNPNHGGTIHTTLGANDVRGVAGFGDNSIDRPQRKHSHCGSH